MPVKAVAKASYRFHTLHPSISPSVSFSYIHKLYDRSVSNFTNVELEHMAMKTRIRRVTPTLLKAQFLQPHVYNQHSSVWAPPQESITEPLKLGSILKIVSWNLHPPAPDPKARAIAALAHIEKLFGQDPDYLVIMLQGVFKKSLQAILEDQWVRRHFTLANVQIPKSSHVAPSFRLMLVPKHLKISKCIRIPFGRTRMKRDALVVDVPLENTKGQMNQPEVCLRLCTTQLESLRKPNIRLSQLTLISRLLKGKNIATSRVVAGIVGGTMNSSSRREHKFHRYGQVDLKDVWEDAPMPAVSASKPSEKDTSFGRARGDTWGYQSIGVRKPQRLDKFFYTGANLETVLLEEVQDVAGKLGRLGIGLKTEVEAWEYRGPEISSVFDGELLKMGPEKEALSPKWTAGLSVRTKEDMPLTKIPYWVSDHFGIAVGFRIGESRST